MKAPNTEYHSIPLLTIGALGILSLVMAMDAGLLDQVVAFLEPLVPSANDFLGAR